MFDYLESDQLFCGLCAKSAVLVALLLALFPGTGLATTKGLNQIVTPDVQPDGQLSVSFQQQSSAIGFPSELQFEYGITPRFEAAVFQGFSPNVQVLNTELGLVQHLPYLLSTGFSNWNSLGGAPQPYLISGYYTGLHKLMAGGARVGNQWEGILGWGYQAQKRVLLQLDFQSGAGNSSTAGFTYTITPNLSLNPALYYTNYRPHALLGYAVLTWNIQASLAKKHPVSPQSGTPNTSGQ